MRRTTRFHAMNVFAGAWVAFKGGLYGMLLGMVIGMSDTLFGLPYMPNRVMANSFIGIILLEWVARVARGVYEGYMDDSVGFFSRILQSFFENIAATFFYIITATAMWLFSLLFAHRPDIILYAISRGIRDAAVFGLALMSITFTIVQLKGEEGALLFFSRLKQIITNPKDQVDIFIMEDRE